METVRVGELLALSGQAAIVTGSAKGIGRAIALRLAEAGAAVTVADVDGGGAEETVSLIRSAGGKAQAVRADASNPADAERVAKGTVDAFGRLDVLVNNAGIFPIAAALELSEALWDRVLDLNLKGAFFFSQACAKRMAERGGAIVNIASIDALHPTGRLAAYDASKGGLLMLTRSLALELAPHRIRVNAICPGAIHTPGADETLKEMGGSADPDRVRRAFEARIPLGRMGDADEIATVALFLAGRGASYVTGSSIVVDGGYLIG